MKKYSEDLMLDFKDYSQLSYDDLHCKYVHLFLDNISIGLMEVSTDRQNKNREYIIINHKIIYLDTINKKWEA